MGLKRLSRVTICFVKGRTLKRYAFILSLIYTFSPSIKGVFKHSSCYFLSKLANCF